MNTLVHAKNSTKYIPLKMAITGQCNLMVYLIKEGLIGIIKFCYYVTKQKYSAGQLWLHIFYLQEPNQTQGLIMKWCVFCNTKPGINSTRVIVGRYTRFYNLDRVCINLEVNLQEFAPTNSRANIHLIKSTRVFGLLKTTIFFVIIILWLSYWRNFPYRH